MEKPFPAYQGSGAYIFVCYAHLDAETVYSDLKGLRAQGINFWYDEGISAGKSWRAEIATAIAGTSKILLFISEASLKSPHCLREIDYALNHDIEIVPVYLEGCILPGELELGLNRVQALFRKTDVRYMEHLLLAMREPAVSAPLHVIKKAMSGALRTTILTAGLGVLAMITWTQRDLFLRGGDSLPVIESNPSAFVGYLQGLELMERWDKGDNLDQAIQLFREATTTDPTFALAFARLADTLRIRYALTGVEQWLDEATIHINEAVRLNAGLTPVQVTLGRIHAKRGNIDLAFAAIERALAIDPNDAVANEAIAVMYARQGRLEDAEAAYRKALALEPERITILSSYANFLADQTRLDESIQQWRTIVRLAPDHYAALVNLGSVLMETGNLPEAINIYKRAIEIRPSYMGYSNLGTVYTRLERYQDAVVAYQHAIELDDTDWLAWGNLAYTYSYIDKNDPLVIETFEHAIQLAETVRQNSPRDAYIYSDLALYYANIGKTGLALQRLETALALGSDSGGILAAAAEVYETIGQREKAIEMAKMALESEITQQRLQQNPALSNLLKDPRMQER